MREKLIKEVIMAETQSQRLYLSDAFKQLKKLKEDLKSIVQVPVGTIMPYAGSLAGEALEELKAKGWLYCDGSPVLKRGEYTDLYHTIGTGYGAPDGDHFNLPDLRGLFLRGRDDGADRDPDWEKRSASKAGGAAKGAVGSYQDDAFETHNHKYKYKQQAHWMKGGSGSNQGAGAAVNTSKWIETNKLTGRHKKETRPKNIYVNYIIKAKQSM